MRRPALFLRFCRELRDSSQNKFDHIRGEKMLNYKRYQRVPVTDYPERTWPDKQITKAPIWCSVDLRDGNQALIDPMMVGEKLEMYDLIVKLGFTDIEVGFPSASQIEYDFIRKLIDEDRIPDGVKLQVLSQCRKEQIDRTFENIKGCKNVVFHIYNSTSTLQRDVVFHMDREQVKELAVQGTKWVKEGAADFDGNLTLEYSPESYTGTELDYALEVCNAVINEWGPTPGHPMIINLPSTVEMTTPNVFADGIEWMSRHMDHRDSVILSVHPHNDRGTGTAAAELALLAGADRLEGTLFGNGERTGNLDLLNVAYNMFSQGMDPKLKIEHIPEIIDVYERCNKMPIDPRHPYGGKLVFTSFSGSHQDAINKGTQAMKDRKLDYWAVPYLTIDPADIGRQYEPIVRINSQSGKGGVAFVMDNYFGFKLPKGMHREFADIIQAISEKEGEVSPDEIMAAFRENYIEKKEPLHFRRLQVIDTQQDNDSEFDTKVILTYTDHGIEETIEGVGNGPLDATRRGIRETMGREYRILDYTEHALSSGADAQAAAYIHLMDGDTGEVTWGVGVSSNITRASVRAIFSAMNRLGAVPQRGIKD